MKVYLATPMNGRPIETIKEKIADCAAVLVKNGIDFFNPFMETVAEDNAIDGIVQDKRPIEILCDTARYIEDCDAVMFIGTQEELKQSMGCQVETVIAANYDKGCYLYDNGVVTGVASVKLSWRIEGLEKKV